MRPYLPLWIGGAVSVAALALMLAPTECFVIQNMSATRVVVPDSPIHHDIARYTFDRDGNAVHSTRVLSSLDEGGVIVVDDPPNSVLDALLFWAGKDWVTIPDPEDGYKSYHVECNDAVSQSIQWMFPSMFPIRV